MEFYTSLPSREITLQQGDLLEGVPFTYFPLSNASVLLADNQPARRNLTGDVRDVVFVSAMVEFSWAIVLSQTCDIQPDPVAGFSRKPILMARVRPIKELIKNFKDTTTKDAVSSVRSLATAGKSPTLLYLPEYAADSGRFPRSGADLLDVQRFSPQDLPVVTSLLRLRLSEPALQALQERCAYCFGRFGAPDDLYFSATEWSEVERVEAERRKNAK